MRRNVKEFADCDYWDKLDKDDGDYLWSFLNDYYDNRRTGLHGPGFFKSLNDATNANNRDIMSNWRKDDV